LIVVSQASR